MKVREKKNLVRKYSELREQIIKTLENSDYEVDVDGDVVDRLQGQSLVIVQNQLSKNNLIKLRAIDLALEMIDKGEYGYCHECGNPIASKRLEAIPGVTTCVLCAELVELHR
jgi:DnaK suppressor protein